MPSSRMPAVGPDARAMALSDGIFAVVITLLVLDLRLPDVAIPNDQALQQRLVEFIPGTLTFLLSFVVVALYWLSHRRLNELIREPDRVIQYTNLLFLLTVCFIPAPTSVLGRYNDFATAVVVYAASQVLTNATLTFMWWYGVFRLSRHPGEERTVGLYFTLRSLATTCIFLVSIPIALISPVVGRTLWIAIPIAYVVIGRMLHPRVPAHLRPSF